MKKKVLVVDNNPVIITLIEKFLAKQGHEVKTALNGLQALEVIETYMPDIMFVDLVMPKINGRQFCQVVRGKASYDTCVIAIITATAVEDERIAFHEFGADYCIAKGPFNEMSAHILEVMTLQRNLGQKGAREFVYGADTLYKREVTKELLLNNHHLEMVLQHVSDGVIEFTSERKIVFTNLAATEMSKSSESGMLSADLLSLFKKEDHPHIQKKILEANRKQLPTKLDHPVPLGEKLVMVSFLPISEDAQKCCIALAQDVSSELDRDEAAKRLVKQAKVAHTARLIAVGELASGIAHEMRQPISVIDLACQYLSGVWQDGPADSIDVLSKIKNQCQRLSALSDNVRLFTRSDRDAPQELVFADVIEKGLSFFQEQFRLHEITIREEISPSLPKARINPRKFEQVLVNFLSNARHAVDARGELEASGFVKEVVIRLYSSAGDIVFEVGDNGIGMSDEVRRQCLDSFFSTKNEQEGTGLGLSIVEDLVSEFGGRLEIESTEEVGSTFRITVPKKSLKYE